MRSRAVLWLAGAAICAASIAVGVRSWSEGRAAARAGSDAAEQRSRRATTFTADAAPATVASEPVEGRRALESERPAVVVEEAIAPGCGAFAGRVLCDEGVPLESVVVRAGSRDHYQSRKLAPDGSFRFADLLPGPNEYFVRASDFSLVVGDDLVIAAGETARIAKLDPLDLRGRFRILHLRVLRPDGEPLAGEPAALRESRGAERRATLDAQGRLELVAYAWEERFLLDVPYFRSAWITWSAAEQDVILQPPLALWLDLDSSCADVYEALAVNVVPPSALSRSTSSIEHRIGSDGSAEFALELAGTYRLEWRVLGSLIQLESEPREVVVVDADGPQRVSCSFDAATMAAIRAAAAR